MQTSGKSVPKRLISTSRTSTYNFRAELVEDSFASIRVLKSCCLDCRLHYNESNTEYINTGQYPKDLKSFPSGNIKLLVVEQIRNALVWVAWKKLEENYGAHEPSKQFQNLLEIYSVVSRELTTLWFRNMDINYKRSQNIGWNEHKSWPWSSSRINHKTFNGLSTQHEKQYLGILRGSREKWYESYSLLIRKQPTSRDANGTGFPVKWRVW